MPYASHTFCVHRGICSSRSTLANIASHMCQVFEIKVACIVEITVACAMAGYDLEAGLLAAFANLYKMPEYKVLLKPYLCPCVRGRAGCVMASWDASWMRAMPSWIHCRGLLESGGSPCGLVISCIASSDPLHSN